MERKLALSVRSVPGSAPCISASWQIRLLGFRDRTLLTSHSLGMIPSLWAPTPKLQKEPGRGWRFRMSWKKLVVSFSGGFLTSYPPLTYYFLPHPSMPCKTYWASSQWECHTPWPHSFGLSKCSVSHLNLSRNSQEEWVMSLTNGNLVLWYSFLFLLFL